MKRLFTLFFFTFFVANAQFKVTHYNTLNSELPHDLCYQIIQDKDNFIWLGTDNGLVKFNGLNFQNFNRKQGLSNSFVIDVFEDNKEKLVATWGGGCYSFNGKLFKNLTFKNLNFSKQLQIVKLDNNIFSLENRFRINYYNTITKEIKFFTFCLDKNGYKWREQDIYKDIEKEESLPLLSFNLQIQKIDNKIYCFSDKNSPQFEGVFDISELPKAKQPFPFLNSFQIIGLQKSNTSYIAVTPNSIIEFNEKGIIKIELNKFSNKKILQFTSNNLFKIYLFQNEKNNEKQIYIEERKSKKGFTLEADYLKSPISDILISSDNSIWISTYGNGLFLMQKPIIQVKNNFLRGNYVFDFIEKAAFQYFLIENTLVTVSKTKNTINYIPLETVKSFKTRESDTIYVNRGNSKDTLFVNENTIIKSASIKNRLTIKNQKIKYGDNEMFYFKSNQWEKVNFNLSEEEIIFFKIKKILFFDYKYWVISNKGIFIYDKNFKYLQHLEKNKDFITALEYNNKLYVLNFLGFSVLENDKFKKYDYINNENDAFNDFLVAKNGDLWLASQKGLVLFKNNFFYKFTKNEGLSSTFYSKIFNNSSNEILALGNNGVDIINPNFNSFSTTSNLYISNNETKFPLKKVNLISKKENFTIKIEMVGFQKTRPIIEYKLDNLKWKKLNTGFYDFTNFSSGNYKIQFRGKYPFSNYTYSPSYNVNIEPVWYLKWFVIIPLIVIICGTIFFLVHLRIKQLKKRNKNLLELLDSNKKLEFQLNEMRHNVSQDFHDELGNKIAGITMMSDRLLYDKRINENENINIVERINKDSQDLYNGIRDFIWSIDAKNDTLDELITVLIDFGIDLFQNSNILFTTNNQVINKDLKLPVYWNRQLLLLFKEAMTNALKHSKANSINLEINLENDILKITLQDDGIGFEEYKLKRKNGLLNLYKRSEKIGGLLEISNDNGTKITFAGKI